MRNFRIELHYFATPQGKADAVAAQKVLREAGFKAALHLRSGTSPQLEHGTITNHETHVLHVTSDNVEGGFALPYHLIEKLHHIDDDASWE
jgi:hypothetical protein